MEQQPLIVQAEFPFRGDNNDELCFKKGDIITVTQREEGGWWEGTLNDKTGWFPSNYVKEYKAALPISETIRPPEEIQEYRSVVLKDLLESEKAHVAEITGLLENFLEPLQTSQILNNDEYAQLMCNFIEVVETHDNLYRCLEECNDRVGKLFLNKAPVMKSVHQAYCAAHPRAIVILDKYKDELEKFMERQGAASPGLLVLTTGLSKPFRRLDKYSAMLQELERHMESSHPDRGDTQRSVAVYKDIAATCSATRRQKELELQVLTGPVRGWQGQELSTLGDIIHMGSVAVGPDHRDRYFVLFPQTLLILSVSQRMSAFIYEGKLPLTGIEVRRLDDTELIKNAFEVCGPLIEKIVAVCQGPNEANKWVELLTSANPQTMPINIKRNVSSGAISNVPPLAPPHTSSSFLLDKRGYCARSSFYAYSLKTSNFSVTLPPKNYPPTAPYAALNAHFRQLVKKGLLKRDIVKALLYPSLLNKKYDTSDIKRRKRKTLTRMKKRPIGEDSITEIKESDCDLTESNDESALDLPTDSECDSEAGSCESNPFEYIKFYTGKKHSKDIASTLTHYETFIDHGGSSNDEKTLSKAEKTTKSVQCEIQLHVDEKATNANSLYETEQKTDSLVFGSKAVRVLNRKSSEQSIILTSTARLNIGVPGAHLKPQISDVSQISSFDARTSRELLACENLTDLNDETQFKSKFLNAKTTSFDTVGERSRSMPNYLVGNRFNHSDSTAVYIPTWRDCETQNQSVDHDDKVKRNCHTIDKESYAEEHLNSSPMLVKENEIHSSSIDLPAIMPAPDKISAELLYNLDGSMTSLHRSSSHLFVEDSKNKLLDNRQSQGINLSREASPFKNHSLNSDKRIKSTQNISESKYLSSGRWKELEEIDFEKLERDCEELENYLLMDKRYPSPRTSQMHKFISSNIQNKKKGNNLPSHITEESDTSKSDFDTFPRKYEFPVKNNDNFLNREIPEENPESNLKKSSETKNEGKECESNITVLQKAASFDVKEKILRPNEHKKFEHQLQQNASTSSSGANPIRRCISYQYISMGLNLQNNSNIPGSMHGDGDSSKNIEKPNNTHQKFTKSQPGTKCKCCESSQCPSPRSSDSGMAGSCTIASPENFKYPEEYYYPFNTDIVDDILENKGNELQQSQSVSNIPAKFDVCGMFRNKFLTQSQEQAILANQEEQNNTDRKSRDISKSNVTHNVIRGRSVESICKPMPLKIHTQSVRVKEPRVTQTEQSEVEKIGVFKTGLYAHWWKKENLPIAVIRGILSAKESSQNIPQTNTPKADEISKPTSSQKLSHRMAEPTSLQNKGCIPMGDKTLEQKPIASTNGGVSGSDVAASKPRNDKSTTTVNPKKSTTATAAINKSNVTTQTEPIIQSSPKLQSILHTQQSTTSTASSTSTTTTNSSGDRTGAGCSGSNTSNNSNTSTKSKPQIKFSPDIEEYFKTGKSNAQSSGSGGNRNNKDTSNSSGTKRKNRKHKS
ncbi:uncharacterized protein LOC129605372 isoform X1 [Condylostylus longicornis]|uniref:uncharacterized protein LOC129605372 isoform X1 n=1 Tax=Condylostylus longicornis TaxID=2530218 RepID=UPI00244E1004|nr:uncharacterized protein LOC129605372 isoform X1 [Condylostylus longicornis]XP_055371074.1 uncharacterized protein LOC129605372 isoform X1 [Condylostylus longicornis]XP_055371081.1 uncharacterized protein LOC129605372 isoform X1 [Condylostylus longicornis]